MLENSIYYWLTSHCNSMKTLNKINNEIKGYINQANFISQKQRNQIIKMLGEEFSIDLPLENFANIDVILTEEGNLIMRGDQYNAPTKLTFDEVEKKYNNFKEKADAILNKKEINYYNRKDINNILNILIVIVLSVIYVFVVINAIRALLSLNLFTFSILAMILSSWLVPGIKNRFEQAKNFLKRKFKK